MIYPRPYMLRTPVPILARQQGRTSVMAGLGELGDAADGASSVSSFRTYLETYISGKAGPAYLANAKLAPTLAGAIGVAAAAFDLGEGGNLPADQQAYWNQWRAQSYDPNSNDNVGYLFGKLISGAKNQLVAACIANGNWWTDPASSAAAYTLMDTSTNGTTWYGGATVASKLSNDQWSTIFTKGWAAIQKGVVGGVLPLTYLEVFCRGLLQQPASRRMPMFVAPPGNLPVTDPKGIAFRTAMKQFGWNSVVDQWFGYTQQAWAAENAAYEQSDAAYGSAITALSYITGEKILEQIQAKAQEYTDARASAAQAINDFNTILNGPTGSQVTEQDKAVMAALTQTYQSTDQLAYGTMSPIGAWNAGAAGSLNGLGALQLIVAGVLAVTALGIIAYVVTLMTKCSRDAAAQTKATAASILATVATVSDSCQRTYDASAKDSAAETALQTCMMQTKALTDSIPKPPEGSDPMGLKWIAMLGAVGVAGLIAVSFIKSRASK